MLFFTLQRYLVIFYQPTPTLPWSHFHCHQASAAVQWLPANLHATNRIVGR